jgi:hypothetical protein
MHRFIAYLLIPPAILAGYLGGVVITWQQQSTPIHVSADTRQTVPVIRIEGVEDGAVIGSVQGQARLVAGQAVSTATGSFRIPLPASLLSGAGAPAGARFVASKRGKKYYPVGSPGAERLSPANRVYFKTAEEAKKAGFAP